MKPLIKITETILVLISGLIAYVYGLFKYTADVLLTTGGQVVDIWSRK